MKKIVTVLAILIVALTFGQSENTNSTITETAVKIETVDVSVTVDSIEEIESTFTIDAIKSIFEESDTNEKISFKIICNKEAATKDVESYTSFKVEGNTNNIEAFITQVKKIKQSAINYYKTK